MQSIARHRRRQKSIEMIFFSFCENEVQPVAFLLFCPHCYGMDKDSFTKSLCVLNVKSLLINSKLYKKVNFKKIRVFTLFIAPVHAGTF